MSTWPEVYFASRAAVVAMRKKTPLLQGCTYFAAAVHLNIGYLEEQRYVCMYVEITLPARTR